MKKRLFEIQFFNHNTNVTSDAGMSAEMKTFYNDTLIDVAGPELIHDQFADKYPIPKNGGKSIEFRKCNNLKPATTPLTEGVTPQGNKLTWETITATVEQYGDFVELSDMVIMTAIDNNVVMATKKLGGQAGETLDCITRDTLCGGTSVFYAGGKTSRAALTAEDKITLPLLFDVAAYLKVMHAPKINGSFASIIHPYVSADVMKLDGWMDVSKYQHSEQIFEGEIGKIAGIRFFETSNAKIWKGAEDNAPENLGVFSTLFVGGGAYATTEITGGGLQTIIKQLGSGDDPLNQRATVGWKATKVSERLVEQYMVRVESCTDASAKVDAN